MNLHTLPISMTRKRIKREQVPNEKKRQVVFTKRVQSLTNKANELSILCGVDVAMVVHKPTTNNEVLWPCPETFRERLQKFLDFPEFERAKKMVVHDKHLDNRLKEETKDAVKSHNKMDMKECQLLMNELVMKGKDFNEVDLVQLNKLQSFADEMLKKLGKRDEELNNENAMQHLPIINPPHIFF
ncbi:hypothetical protein DH2020_047622 [Rehmannia glutinosa]|uniref:MADS-box domain-containing protein n=1 Tax=Rehmannia glutinosa TaxID=99300 RepID=A0ABR0U915_REHGL